LAWWFRYEPLPPGGYVWDRWTRQMCQSESLSKGQGCNYEIALAEYERKNNGVPCNAERYWRSATAGRRKIDPGRFFRIADSVT
jgi:hypothetical protein